MEHSLTIQQGIVTEEVRRRTLVASVEFPEVGSFYASMAESCGEILRGTVSPEEMPGEVFPIWELLDRWLDLQEEFRAAFTKEIATFALDLSELSNSLQGDL